MRIVCDNCGAKYQISDEKVRNKVFKIRCKRCAHVIVVRANEPAEAADAPAQSVEAAAAAEAPPAAEAPAPGAVWYVVINREQVGPLTPDQVLAHFERKEIDADTFTWAEGMADWVRLATIPEFADHVAAAAPQPEPTEMLATSAVAGAAAAAEQAAPAASGSLFDDGDDDVIASNNQSESLFGDDKDGFDGGGPRVSSGQQLRNQRNENSVLFSLDSLAADAEPNRPSVTNTGGSDASGLIDISALGAPGGGASVAPGALDDAFGGGSDAGGFAPVSAAPAGPLPSYVTRPSGGGGGKIALFAVLGLLLLGGGGFAAWYAMRDKPADPAQPGSVASASPATAKSATPATVQIGQPNTAASVASAAPASAAPVTATSAAPETAAAPASVAANTATKPKRRRASRRRATPAPKRTPSAEDAPPKAAPKPVAVAAKPARKPRTSDGVDDLLSNLDGGGRKAPARNTARAAQPAAAADPMLPAKLSKSQILSVVRRNASKIRGCKSKDPNASGNVMVQMVIGKNGRVSSAKSKSPYAGTPIGSCVEGKVKTFRFPQFSGDAMRINMPFRI